MSEIAYSGKFADVTVHGAFTSIHLFSYDVNVDTLSQAVANDTDIYKDPYITINDNILKFHGLKCEILKVDKRKSISELELDDIFDGVKVASFKSSFGKTKYYLSKGYYLKKNMHKITFQTTLWKLTFWNSKN